MLNWLINHSPLLYFTQSIWRDEAYSILVAEKPLLSILGKLTFEPPVYYTLLHFWLKIFGNSEIAARSLSLLGFSLATVTVIFWAEKLFPKRWLNWYLPLLFFVNPLLLYYAFEIRTYGWYALFAVLSMYSYLEKKWHWFFIVSTLGFYTHTYFLIIPFTQFIHWFVSNYKNLFPKFKFKVILKDNFIRSLIIFFLAILPWLIKIAGEVKRLRQSWYFPVDFHLIKSVLGNLYLNYEGTPWYLWSYTAFLSVFLVCLFLYVLIFKQKRVRNIFFFLMVFAPLIVVISISFFKPLFVNRYFLPTTIAEVFLIVFALESIKKPIISKIFGAMIMITTLVFNFWYPAKHAKTDIRKTIFEINAIADENDRILAKSPLIFFETIYYSNNRERVFIYNPDGVPFPWFVGDVLVSQDQMIKNLPIYPAKAYMVHEDGTYEIVYKAPLEISTNYPDKQTKLNP